MVPVDFADQLVRATPGAGRVAAPDVVDVWDRCAGRAGVPDSVVLL